MKRLVACLMLAATPALAQTAAPSPTSIEDRVALRLGRADLATEAQAGQIEMLKAENEKLKADSAALKTENEKLKAASKTDVPKP